MCLVGRLPPEGRLLAIDMQGHIALCITPGKHACVSVLTSSLSRMRPNSGLDMDHWLRQFSNIIV